MKHIREMIAENALRNRRLQSHYDPLTGREACGNRRMVTVEWEPTPVWLPETMLLSPEYARLRTRDPQGPLKVWAMPVADTLYNRYVVAVDVGGRSRGSDWSVIAVFDRAPAGGGGPAVVAQWRGHCDHDILGWKAAAIATWYNRALLVVESNSLEAAAEGPSQYILEELNAVYSNLYVRTIRDNSLTPDTYDCKVGFHTNRRTKALIITMLIAMVREAAYCERDAEAVAEMAVYRQLPSGNFAARSGFHDDILMTRAIGLYVCATTPPPCTIDFRELLDRPRW